MPFLRVGTTYLNQDLIERITVSRDAQDAPSTATVYFASGAVWLVELDDEVRALVAAIEAQDPQSESHVEMIARAFNMTTDEVLAMISEYSPRGDAP